MPTVTTAAATWHCLVVRPSAKTAAQARYLGARADEEVGVLDFASTPSCRETKHNNSTPHSPFPPVTENVGQCWQLAGLLIHNAQHLRVQIKINAVGREQHKQYIVGWCVV
jgi:hypothetical protein